MIRTLGLPPSLLITMEIVYRQQKQFNVWEIIRSSICTDWLVYKIPMHNNWQPGIIQTPLKSVPVLSNRAKKSTQTKKDSFFLHCGIFLCKLSMTTVFTGLHLTACWTHQTHCLHAGPLAPTATAKEWKCRSIICARSVRITAAKKSFWDAAVCLWR